MIIHLDQIRKRRSIVSFTKLQKNQVHFNIAAIKAPSKRQLAKFGVSASTPSLTPTIIKHEGCLGTKPRQGCPVADVRFPGQLASEQASHSPIIKLSTT